MADEDFDGIDIEGDARLSVNDNVLGSIAGAVQRYDELEAEKATTEARVEEITSALTAMKMDELPELLKAAGTTSFTDAKTGRVIELELLVSATLPKDPEKRQAIINYVKERGHGDLVKTTITLDFGRDEGDAAAATMKLLQDAGLTPTIEESIHTQTLGAYVRECVTNGVEIDCERAGAYVVSLAVPRLPKAKKATKVKAKAV